MIFTVSHGQLHSHVTVGWKNSEGVLNFPIRWLIVLFFALLISSDSAWENVSLLSIKIKFIGNGHVKYLL
jgi:hypothetical protein